MNTKSAKDKKINQLIGFATFILSVLTGIGIGAMVLCGGTVILHERNANLRNYPVKVLIGNIIVSILYAIKLGLVDNTDPTGFSTIFSIFVIPMYIIAVLIIILFRLCMQALLIYLLNKPKKK